MDICRNQAGWNWLLKLKSMGHPWQQKSVRETNLSNEIEYLGSFLVQTLTDEKSTEGYNFCYYILFPVSGTKKIVGWIV